MGIGAQAVLAGQVEMAAKAAGLTVVSSAVGQDFSGNPTTRFNLALVAAPARTQVLELSDQFDFSQADLLVGVGSYLAAVAKRLKNPSRESATADEWNSGEQARNRPVETLFISDVAFGFERGCVLGSYQHLDCWGPDW